MTSWLSPSLALSLQVQLVRKCVGLNSGQGLRDPRNPDKVVPGIPAAGRLYRWHHPQKGTSAHCEMVGSGRIDNNDLRITWLLHFLYCKVILHFATSVFCVCSVNFFSYSLLTPSPSFFSPSSALSLPLTLIPSLLPPPSLCPSLTHSSLPSLPPSLLHSLFPSLPPSLPPFLLQSWSRRNLSQE